jgi:hypothetical protein
LAEPSWRTRGSLLLGAVGAVAAGWHGDAFTAAAAAAAGILSTERPEQIERLSFGYLLCAKRDLDRHGKD